ncbi:hypothetical protein ACHHYP_01973 [Achlya hypogyna]|uniref:WRKY transcription factor 19 n=1 Tax=Achlya hypogyna TaxID=1202772 RepID=A0A1V9Z7R3_ACHHY|nr:hypothetical protein ACHHYP_01973 [Achlya hypogyna]
MCSIHDCANQVYARGLCVRHGGRHRCFHPGCSTSARVGGYCSRHGGTKIKKHCIVDGCANKVNRNGRCVRHGGRRQCKVTDCVTHARSGGYCSRHAKSPLPPSPRSSMCDTDTFEDLMLDSDIDLMFLQDDAPLLGGRCRGEDIDDSILECLLMDKTTDIFHAL